jgi:7,8-dihydropterin-6-yl-methyl-4-(beta-D-ribofuranosyl)aminobenzene 5'-phosphate synthase
MKKITCVVDDSAQYPFQREHGLAFRIETDHGCVLFDTGRSESVLMHNLDLLGGHPRNVSAIVLSHAHNDHTGGLFAVLSQKPGLPLYASPDLFRPRFTHRQEVYRPVGLPQAREELARLADLRLSANPVEVVPGVWTTGEIAERPEPEGRSANHFVLEGESWRPDPYRDDTSLVLETRNGLVVVCGCCHAGLLNTLAQVRQTFQRPIIAVLGGTHLLDADEAYLEHVVGMLHNDYGSPRLHLNHCTGERAMIALANVFGDRVSPCPAGTTLTFRQEALR